LDFLKRIFNKFRCTKKVNKDEITYVQLEDQSKITDPCSRFADLFRNLGGSFGCYKNEKDIDISIQKILKKEKLKNLFCCEKKLHERLDKLKIRYTEDLSLANDIALISCEYLVAFDGRIVLSYNNIMHFPTSMLPEKVIIVANVSQIVPDLSTAMMKVKRSGIPKNITSISGNISELDFPNRKKYKFFLLLQEN